MGCPMTVAAELAAALKSDGRMLELARHLDHAETELMNVRAAQERGEQSAERSALSTPRSRF